MTSTKMFIIGTKSIEFLELIRYWMTAKHNIQCIILLCFAAIASNKTMTSTKKFIIDTKSNEPEVLLAIKILNTTCVRQADGRYETGFLWKDDSSLPDNRSQALTHLNHLVNRLQKEPEQ